MKTAILILTLLATACGGASSEQRATACQITNAACAACETARETYCGGEEVEVAE